MGWKSLLPPALRRRLALLRRAAVDFRLRSQGPLARRVGALPPRLRPVAAYRCPIINPPGQAQVFENKLHNLGLACAAMQGLRLGPGERFSFWVLIGDPSAERGYKVASNFIAGRVAFELGGGLCQLSGTLYNAGLLAGLRRVERHAHSIDAYGPRRYVPLGRDATVAYGYKDLQFTNDWDQPLWLDLRLKRGSLEARWLGASRPFRRVALKVDKLSPEGRHVRASRLWHQADGSRRREDLGEDRYGLPRQLS